MLEGSGKTRLLSRKLLLSVTCAIVILILVGAVLFLILANGKTNEGPTATALKKAGAGLTFPIYYPSNMPTYFFVDANAVTDSNNTLIFAITRNDGQQVLVTEEALPANFDLSQVTGTQATIKNLGKVVIGTGYLGYRAVVNAGDKTLLLMSCPDTIPAGDFSEIVKSFRQD